MSVSLEISDDIAIVTIDNPPVNALSQTIRQQLIDMVTQTDANPAIAGVVLRCAGRTFIAGADITEFGKPPVAPHLPDVVRAIETATKPWVAAIHGSALGGGLEIALGCHYRMANIAAKFGLPEVTLGLIPGAGGTVRLPRLIAPPHALTMIAGGKPITAMTALEWGLIDAIADEADPHHISHASTAQSALAAAIRALLATTGFALRPVLDQPIASIAAAETSDPAPSGGADISNEYAALRARFIQRARGQHSPLAACAAVDQALASDAATALAAERASFLELRDSPQAAALRHIFFAERGVSKLPNLHGAAVLPLRHIGVVGGGTMGSGIAAACLLAGLHVHITERDDSAATAGMDRVTKILGDSHKRGLITAARHAELQSALSASADYADLSTADLVIEAAFEAIDVKQQLFAALDAHCRADAILATNTSYLDIDVIAAATRNPSRVIGLHFFSPAHIMKLLELVVPQTADPAIVATGLAFGKRLRKITVPAGVCDGFIGNRIMAAYRRECDYMIEDGALPHEIDAAMCAFGFPMGIFAMQDLAGLDIAFAMRQRRAATRPADERCVEIPDLLCAAGRFGRKAGHGWYDYSTDKNGAVDPEVTALIEAESARKAITRQSIDADEIIRRILTIMQREGSAIVAEGIAQSTAAVDVTMINGYGFPRWRGGPMFMLQSVPADAAPVDDHPGKIH